MLIAYRCKKDFSSQQNGRDCPSEKVRSRLQLKPWDPSVYCPDTSAPELNSICFPCPSWDPAHEKPQSYISDSCRLAETARCPSWPEVRWTAFVSPAKVSRMDAVCLACKLYKPR